MQEQEPARKKWVYRAVMWVAAIVILAWLFKKTPPQEVLSALKRTDPFFFSGVALTFALVTLLTDSVTHYWLFNRFNPSMDFKTVLVTRGESYLLLSLGFLYGQGGLAFLVSRRTGKPLSEVTGSILFIMFNSLVTIMVLPTIALVFFIDQMASPGFRGSPEWEVMVRWLMISWPLIILHFIFWSNRFKNPLRVRMKKRLTIAFDKARPVDYLAAIGFRLVQAGNWLIFTWLALRACHVLLPVKSLVLMGPLVLLISAVPTPGRLGTTQAGWKLLFEHAADPASLIAFSLLWSISISIIRWLAGAIFLAVSGLKREPSTGEGPPAA